ncbi:hypothetical protein IM660_15715 [Ruania alkalisoli]|uniref:Uncharacterized protein n=1 Tax=Ruania alkalisoli TaxID=2779775 RepID=A0A7M1SRI9_9MICO|nr:DUF5997 family protein [Ruania alkalisoli]QOR70061.1 hypothetical protein IM660_15715 [Ruania alkalisoli]
MGADQQRMKAITAAKKLGIYLPAAPQEFQAAQLSRQEVEELERHPPDWLTDLRRNGPHPRPVVAGRLGISISGLTRAGIEGALTTAEINELRDDPPDWLTAERAVQEDTRQQDQRRRENEAERRARAESGNRPRPHS